MHIPPYQAQHDLNKMQSLIESHSLGAWITLGAEGLIANHIPFAALAQLVNEEIQ